MKSPMCSNKGRGFEPLARPLPANSPGPAKMYLPRLLVCTYWRKGRQIESSPWALPMLFARCLPTCCSLRKIRNWCVRSFNPRVNLSAAFPSTGSRSWRILVSGRVLDEPKTLRSAKLRGCRTKTRPRDDDHVRPGFHAVHTRRSRDDHLGVRKRVGDA